MQELTQKIVIDARNSVIAGHGFPLPGGTIDETFYMFSPRGETMVEDTFWLPWFDRCLPFAGLTDDRSTLMVDFSTAATHTPSSPAFFIGSRSNWGHWLGDFIPRLWFWEHHPERDSLPLVFGPLSSVQKKTLAMFDVEADDCGQIPVAPGRLTLVQGERILYPTTMPRNSACAHVRGKFGKWKPENRNTPRCLYLSRRLLGERRRVSNETEVSEHLTRRDFQTLDIETLPFSEQMDLLTQAKIVVIPFGGGQGSTHICQPGTVIVMLASWDYVRRTPPELLRRETIPQIFGSGLPTIMVFGEPARPGQGTLDALVHFNLEDIDRAIDQAREILSMRSA